jgi:carboxyl-terminal processing protease
MPIKIYMKKFYLILLVTGILLNSCKKEVSPATNPSDATDRDALYSLMNDWYFWYKNMPTVNLNDYKDPVELMNALRYKTLDRWSFVSDYSSFTAQMSGSFVGHGIRFGYDVSSNTVRVVTIFKNSPLYTNGSGGPAVRRGWIIKKLNGQDLAPMFAAGNMSAFNTLIGAPTAGITNTFVFQTSRGNDTTATSAKKSFQVNSVLLYDTIRLKTGITGHLVFNEFIEPSPDELKTAFSFFAAQNVKDLILDMRYNTGGILDVATQLASYIAGTSKFSTPFVTSSFNDKKASSKNETTNFTSVSYPLNLSRLVVITTRETASASEEVINGLKPHLTVTTLGDTTNGKPTGMNVWATNDQKYIFAPVTFELVNSLGQGNFYKGFAPAKYVRDDITRDFKDRNESSYKEAIYFLENGSVSTKGTYIYQPSVQFSEKPEWMNNLFVIDKSLSGR